MKRINIKENQEKTLIRAFLRESSGVNDKMLVLSEKIARDIVFVALPSILSTTYYVSRWADNWDAEYKGEVDGYKYEIFFDFNTNGMLKGEWDDSVRLNYRFIETVFLEDIQRIPITDDFYDEEDEESEFDAYAYVEDALNEYEWQKIDIYEKIQPIILHELTHSLNQDANPMDRLWIKNVNKYVEDDVRDFMYLFSNSEMNSRIASVAPLFHNLLKYETSERDKKGYLQVQGSGKFNELMNKYIWSNDELQLSHMEVLISILEREYKSEEDFKKWCLLRGEEYNASHLEQQIKSVLSSYAPNDIFYALAINEDGLYKKTQENNVKKYYIQDPIGFRKKILLFYQNKLKAYRNKIIRACWEVWTNNEKYIWDADENEKW